MKHALTGVLAGEVAVWWDMQFVVQPILQLEWLNQSRSQQPIWSPEEQLEKLPEQCGMPVGKNDNAPKLTVFTVTPTVQGDAEADEAVPCLSLTWASTATVVVCHCPAAQAWEEVSAWQMCLVQC